MKLFLLKVRLPLWSIVLALCLLRTTSALAQAPTYTVTVSGGNFNPIAICAVTSAPVISASATVSGQLNVNNPNQEYQESGDQWSWTAKLTGYAASQNSGYGSVPSNAPGVTVTTGRSSATVSVFSPGTPGYYQITATGTDTFNVTYNDGKDPPSTKQQSASGSTTLKTTVIVMGPSSCTATPGSDYVIINDGNSAALVAPPSAVTLTARAGITPADAQYGLLDVVYPGYQIGIVQNMEQGTYATTYGGPQNPKWNAGVASGTKGNAQSEFSIVRTLPACSDAPGFTDPYPMPYAGLADVAANPYTTSTVSW